MKMPQLGLHLIMFPMNISDSLCALRALRIESTWAHGSGSGGPGRAQTLVE